MTTGSGASHPVHRKGHSALPPHSAFKLEAFRKQCQAGGPALHLHHIGHTNDNSSGPAAAAAAGTCCQQSDRWIREQLVPEPVALFNGCASCTASLVAVCHALAHSAAQATGCKKLAWLACSSEPAQSAPKRIAHGHCQPRCSPCSGLPAHALISDKPFQDMGHARLLNRYATVAWQASWSQDLGTAETPQRPSTLLYGSPLVAHTTVQCLDKMWHVDHCCCC